VKEGRKEGRKVEVGRKEDRKEGTGIEKVREVVCREECEGRKHGHSSGND
jgi:hypothetical protein